MQICFSCTNCRKLLVAGASAANRQVQCPACGEPAIVPDPGKALPAALVEGEPAGTGSVLSGGGLNLHERPVGEKANVLNREVTDADEQPILDVDLEEIEEEDSSLTMAMGKSVVAVEVPPDKPPLVNGFPSLEILPDEEADPVDPVFAEFVTSPDAAGVRAVPWTAATRQESEFDVEILPCDSEQEPIELVEVLDLSGPVLVEVLADPAPSPPADPLPEDPRLAPENDGSTRSSSDAWGSERRQHRQQSWDCP